MEDYFEKFKQAVMQADRICLPEKRRKFLETRADDFRRAFAALELAGEWGNIGMMLQILDEAAGPSPVALFPERLSHALCDALENYKSDIDKRHETPCG